MAPSKEFYAIGYDKLYVFNCYANTITTYIRRGNVYVVDSNMQPIIIHGFHVRLEMSTYYTYNVMTNEHTFFMGGKAIMIDKNFTYLHTMPIDKFHDENSPCIVRSGNIVYHNGEVIYISFQRIIKSVILTFQKLLIIETENEYVVINRTGEVIYRATKPTEDHKLIGFAEDKKIVIFKRQFEAI